MKIDYTYKRPDGDKYVVSISKWNKVFWRRGRWPMRRVEVYVTEDMATVQYVHPPSGKILLTLFLPILLPIWIILVGLPTTYRGLYDIYRDKHTGSFGSDEIYRDRGEGDWSKLMNLIGRTK